MKQLIDTFLSSLVCLLLAGIPLGASAANKPAHSNTLIVAVTPQLSPAAIYSAWSPLLAALESSVGARMQLRVYDSKSKFDADVLAGIPDLVYLNSEAVAAAKQANGYRPLIRDAKQLTGILLVPKESPIMRIEDLNGRTIVFPWETAFSSSIYIRMLLRDKMNITFNAAYAGNHQNVYRQLLLGEADAGGTVPNILAKESEGVRSRLRTIYTTPGLAPHAIAAHPRVPMELGEQLSQAIIQLAQKNEGKAMLDGINIPNPINADYPRDYAPLEKLHSERNAKHTPKSK